MEVDENEEIHTREILLYLEFNNKTKDYIFDDKVFLRITRFEEGPLVQLNNFIFRGEYRSCVGTNLFFLNSGQNGPENIFHFGVSKKLVYLASQFKLLELKTMKIPSDMRDLPEPLHDIKFKTNYDYASLLKKFASGALDLKEDFEIVPRKPGTLETNNSNGQPQKDNVVRKKTNKALVSKVPFKKALASTSRVRKLENREKPSLPSKKVEIVNIIDFKYEKLKRLALRPTRRKKEPEPVAECEEKYKDAYAFNSLKCKVTKPSDYFRTNSEKFNDETLVGAVDVDRSVIQGIIEKSPEYYRVLSEDEKMALLSTKNFENLSLAARYMVLKSHLEYLESTLPTLCQDEIYQKDEYGRTVRESIKTQKRLLRALGGLVKQKYCYDSDEDS